MKGVCQHPLIVSRRYTMIQIGSPKIKLIENRLNENNEGISFEIVKRMGLNIICKHDATDDKTAKAAVKNLIASLPELKNAFSSVQIVDENGRII